MAQPDLSSVFSEAEMRQLHSEGFELHPKADAERWQRMANAYRTLGLWDEKGFCCESRDECEQAFKACYRGFELPHKGTVGDYLAAYDLTCRGQALRVCVVSRDAPGSTTCFEDRTEDATYNILQARVGGGRWASTIKLLNLLFFGDYEVSPNETYLVRKLHVHVRAVKCNPGTEVKDQTGKNWIPPSEMFNNCLPHLTGEIYTLEPTIIIAQGLAGDGLSTPCTTSSVAAVLGDSVDDWGEDVYEELLADPPSSRKTVMRRWVTDWGSCLLLGCYHPSNYGAYSWPLKYELKPAIATLRENGFTI